jgi:hypothetical protein
MQPWPGAGGPPAVVASGPNLKVIFIVVGILVLLSVIGSIIRAVLS